MNVPENGMHAEPSQGEIWREQVSDESESSTVGNESGVFGDKPMLPDEQRETASVEERVRATERALMDLQLRYADMLWRSLPEADRPKFSEVVAKHTTLLRQGVSPGRADQDSSANEMDRLYASGGEDWREQVLALNDNALEAETRFVADRKPEHGGLMMSNLRRTDVLKDYGISPDEELLQIHVGDAYAAKPGEAFGPEALRKAFADLAVSIVERHPQALVVYGDSWLMSHPIAKRLGFTKTDRTSHENGPHVWKQFVSASGGLDENRVRKLLETGKPPFEPRIGFMRTEDFLRRYLPPERRGSIELQEATPESVAAARGFEEEMGALRSAWPQLEEGGIAAFLDRLPELKASAQASGRGDAFVDVLRDAKRRGLDLKASDQLPGAKAVGEAIRAAHEKRVAALRRKKQIEI